MFLHLGVARDLAAKLNIDIHIHSFDSTMPGKINQ